MARVVLRPIAAAAVTGWTAILLTGCEMPTTSLGPGSPPSSPSTVASAPSPSSTTTSAPSSSGASSPGTATGGSTTNPSASRPATVGDVVGVPLPSPSTGFQPPPTDLRSGLTPAPSTSPPTPSPGTLPPGTSTGRKTSISIQLSAGVALAQTLPDGTGMLFSVDYRFQQRSNDQSMRYLWVIVPDRGTPITKEVQLSQSGTLTLIVPGMRPEIGPFHCHIDARHPADSQARRVTNDALMKQPG